MSVRYRLSQFLKDHSIWLAAVASALLTWPAAAELELFEAFYEFSRAHEDWDLDELAILVVNLTIALAIALIVRSRQLGRVLGALRETQETAERQARHDALTGLPNRRAFEEVVTSFAVNDGQAGDQQSVILGIIDLDHFKPINDLHGHGFGDKVLRQTALAIEGDLRPGDTVCRLGGDEFAVVFEPGCTPELAEKICRKVLAVLESTICVGSTRVNVSASIGLARANGEEIGEIGLGKADKALYAAKQSGRGRVAWYDADLDRRAMERATLEADLIEAVEFNQIFPAFQPIFEVGTVEICGLEILARWNHPKRGAVPPSQFIEIAEDIGIIGTLSWSVLRQACKIASNWPEHIKLSFNVSPRQFNDDKMVKTLLSILDDTGFPPKRVEVEITESAVIENLTTAEKIILDLQANGISVALDDFGTGFSSISNLQALPFDRLKIDRSFVTEIVGNSGKHEIVAGIMTMANGLGISVTAEGIETETDLEALRDLRCQKGQGFWYSQALQADEVAAKYQSEWGLHLTSGGAHHGAA